MDEEGMLSVREGADRVWQRRKEKGSKWWAPNDPVGSDVERPDPSQQGSPNYLAQFDQVKREGAAGNVSARHPHVSRTACHMIN